ncbi:MAG: TCR/Tet family MFS transporter [Caulobacter sp.]
MSEPIAHSARKAALGFIFVTALMDVLSLGLMIPVLPNLVKQMAGGHTDDAAQWTAAFGMVWGVMQFFCSPVLGMLSDRYGRRPVILISIFGLGVDYIFMALAPGLWWLFVGRIIHGATAASFSAAGAYIADVTPENGRAKAFGLIGAAWSAGFIAGPALGGLLGEIDLRLPFWIAAGLALLNWLYGLLVLPESLPPERRVPRFDWRKANPVGSLKLLASHPDLPRLGVVSFLMQLAHNAYPSVFVLYTGYRYGWTPFQIGLLMMGSGLLGVVVQGLLVGPIVDRLKERGAVIAGLACFVVSFGIFAFAPWGWLFASGLLVSAFAALIQPGLQGMMTRRVGPAEQGQLQGAGSAIMGLTAIIGPALYGLTLAFSVRHERTLHLPGLPLAIAGLLALAGLAVILRTRRARPSSAAEPGLDPAR